MAGKVHQTLITFVLAIFLLLSCKKEANKPFTSPVSPQMIFVVCEGSLGNGNASIFGYDRQSKNVVSNLYEAANGIGPGDIAEDVLYDGKNLLLTVSNSDRLDVLNPTNWKVIKTITLQKPRNLFQLADGRILIGALFSNQFYILDTATYTFSTRVLPYKNVEGFVEIDNQIFLSCWDDNCARIYVLNSGSLQVIDSIALAGYAPHSMVVDAHKNLWVLSGNSPNNINAFLHQISTVNHSIKKQYAFNSQDNPIRLRTDNKMENLYFLGVDYNGNGSYNGVFKMHITDALLPQQPFIAAMPLQYFWGLGIEPLTDDIYLTDPKGFTQKGAVHIYDKEGKLKSTFDVGVGPGRFSFGW